MDALTKRWAEADHDVTVLTSAPDYPEGDVYDGYENEWLHREERDGVVVYMTKTLPASNDGFVLRGLKFLWFMLIGTLVGLRVARPDIVIATSPQPFTGVTGWIVARLRRAKFVFEVRDLWPESITAASDFDNGLLIAFLDRLVTFLYRRADRLVVVSEGFVPTLVSAGVSERDVWVHPNGVDPTFYERSEDRQRIGSELKGTLEDRFVVSYVGTIGRAHGLSVVVDAAERLQSNSDYDDVLFLFVGTGAKAELLERAASERDLDNVLFVGRRPKADVPDFLDASDVSLVHLKDRDVFRTAIPSKMCEAMATGTPIALGVRGEAERLVESGDVGVVFEPENPDGLVDAVKTLYEDADRRDRFGANGREYVRNHLLWDSIAADYRRNLEAAVRE
ncbi:glycosyltransferase family 4 protein [Natrinema sp. LN54]|uniref:glycosyltransferase family 4 protein n=1 Tax=Natrinema sp. LN54 TaxID=3458705 RepID=UPI004035CEF1